MAVRSDNTGEIKKIVDFWTLKDGIRSESTAAYNSYQNGPAERTFPTTEECMRAKLEEAQLPIEIWDEAVEATNYERNHMDLGPLTKSGKYQCVLQAWKELENPTNISHIRVWGCVAYSHVSPKQQPAGARTDKAVIRGREGVFMGYDNNTDK
ncbi:hypothetical protein K3495_g14742 [Podosphaera aphanis]|nr:hypothetical protein K3495_g14742 [Podosphaera aphanis]